MTNSTDPALRKAVNNKFMKRAIELARRHLDDEDLVSYHGCVIASGGRTLSYGINQSRRHTMVKVHGYPEFSGVHAELDACIRAMRQVGNLEGATVFVARVLKDGRTAAMSRPCDYCLAALRSYGIKRICFTTENGDVAMERIAV